MRASLVVLLLFLSLCLCNGRRDGAGGPPFGRGKTPTSPPREAQEDYYAVLGVARGSSERDIKAAYRRRAMALHPDKGGDEAAFKRLGEAYEVLGDPDKRRLYDRFGKKGLSAGGGGSTAGESSFFHSGQDFQNMFKGFASFSMPLMYNLELSLEDFFRGRTVSVALNGQQFDVEVRPGMTEGTEIRGQVVDGRGTPRELVFILQEKAHSVFTRKNADLLLELRVTLVEALLGFERVLTHLDGSTFTLRSRENEISRVDDTLVVAGLGMPLYEGERERERERGKSKRRGDLFVRIKIDMPDSLPSLSVDERETLRRLLGERERPSGRESAQEKRRRAAQSATFVPLRTDWRAFGRNGAPAEDDFASSFGSFFFQ